MLGSPPKKKGCPARAGKGKDGGDGSWPGRCMSVPCGRTGCAGMAPTWGHRDTGTYRHLYAGVCMHTHAGTQTQGHGAHRQTDRRTVRTQRWVGQHKGCSATDPCWSVPKIQPWENPQHPHLPVPGAPLTPHHQCPKQGQPQQQVPHAVPAVPLRRASSSPPPRLAWPSGCPATGMDGARCRGGRVPAPDTPPVAPLFPASPCWEKGDGQAQLGSPPHGATSSPRSWEEQTLPHRPGCCSRAVLCCPMSWRCWHPLGARPLGGGFMWGGTWGGHPSAGL